MQSVSPVFTKEETQFEFEIAKNQPEYVSVIGLPVTLRILDPKTGDSKEIPNWAIAARFRLSPEERAQVAAGLDLVVTQLTFGKPLAPMNFQLCPAATKPIFEMREEEPLRGPALASAIDEHFKEAGEKISNVVEMPSAADLDAVAEEQQAAAATSSVPDATGTAGSQCACGHEEHSGTCGKPRYSSGDPCLCNTFIDSQNHPQLEV